jgi:cystathionine gamma-synthase
VRPDPHTTALHADDAIAELADIAPAIRPATTFERPAARTYRRDGHETTERLEAVLGALEGGACVVYPSGMGAVAALLNWVRPERIALPDDVYHGVRALVSNEAARGRWEVVAASALEAGDVWWVETPSNPKCLITDVAATAHDARERGVLVVVDATFATPVLQETLALGADFVIHATTKFIAGHSDAMGGAIATGDAGIAAELRTERTLTGAVPGALETWLTLRGVRTLPIRVERQSATAAAIAEFLVTAGAKSVWYPGLAEHPGHDIAARQMSGFGGTLSFEVEEPEEAAAVVAALRVFRNATSLGGVESLAEHRLQSDPHAPPGLIRLAVGLEAPHDLIADLAGALETVGVRPGSS